MDKKLESEKLKRMEIRIAELEQELENERKNRIERKLLGRKPIEEQIKIKIINRRKEGATIRVIAEEYKLSVGVIHKIIKDAGI